MRILPLVILAVLLAAACEQTDSPAAPTATSTPGPMRVTFDAYPQYGVLYSGSTVRISARVTDSRGRNATGTRVQFSTSAGTIEPPDPVIDRAGFAVATLTAAGPATVTLAALDEIAQFAVGAVAPFTVQVTGPAIAPLTDAIYTVSVQSNPSIAAPPQPSSVVVACSSDGNFRTLDRTGGTISCHFGSPGAYHVEARAFGPNGWAATDRREVTAAKGGVIPTTLTLTATEVSGGAGAGFAEWAIVATPGYGSYEWTFGDGSAFSSGRNAEQHLYLAAGVYTVRVTATPSGGGTPVSATTVITVVV